MQHRRVRSGRGAQALPKAIEVGMRKQAVDRSIVCRQMGTTFASRARPAGVSGPSSGSNGHFDDAAPPQRLERRGDGRAVYGQGRRDPSDARRLGPVQRHHQRELPVAQTKRPHRFIETAHECPSCTLQFA
jgi:hypothetical protein